MLAADLFLAEGYAVTVLDNLTSGKREQVPRKASFHELDLTAGDGEESARVLAEMGHQLDDYDAARFRDDVGHLVSSTVAAGGSCIMSGATSDDVEAGATDEEVAAARDYLAGILPLELQTTEQLAGRLAGIRFFAGYSGWGGGQLEAELAESAWLVVPAVADDVFAPDPEAMWRSVLRRQGGKVAMLANFPAHPSLN